MWSKGRSPALGASLALACLIGAMSCDSPLESNADGVDRIALTPGTATLQAGETVTLTAVVLDASGNAMRDRKVVWSTQNASVATVSQSGVVTAVAAGVVQVAGSSGGKSASATITVTARPVSLVRVTPGSATIAVSSSITLQAEALDASGAPVLGRPITWTSSNETIAIVSATGIVAGIAPGSVTISAAIDGRTGTAAITVSPQAVETVAITPEVDTINVGRRLTLRATPFDARNTPLVNRAIAWTSSDPSIATVSSSGEVLALSVGTVRIRATVEGKFAEAIITVLPVPVASVIVAPSQVTLNPGQTSQLTVTLSDSGGNVLTGRTITYGTSHPDIATVSTTGLVTAVAEGSAQIQATSEGKTGIAVITVNPVPVASIRITPNAVTLRVTQTAKLAAQAFDAQNRPLSNRRFTWISGAPAVATVNQSGDVTAVSTGIASVFAAAEGISASATVQVTTVPVASVVVTPSTLSLQTGGSAQLSAATRDSVGNLLVGRIVTWTSNADGVAVVSGTGRVTAVSTGTAMITATSEGQSGTALVTVANVPVASVTVTPASQTILQGQSFVMTATPRDANGNPLGGRAITWSSSAPNVASVDATGLVTGAAQGTATITATSEGKSGSGVVNVAATPPASLTVTPKPNAVYEGETKSLRATITDALGAIVRGRPVSWEPRNGGLVTVSPVSGVPDSATFTGVSAGSTYIIARDLGTGLSDSTQVTVSLVPVTSVTVTPATATVDLTLTTQLTATARDSAGNPLPRTITWSSSAQTIASVGQTTGLVTGQAGGTATIEARAAGAGIGGSDVFNTASVTVNVPVNSVTVTSPRAFVVPGDTMHLTVVLRDVQNNVINPGGRVITFSSSNDNLGTVSSQGVVSGVAPGSVTITAASEGKNGTVSVTVEPGIAAMAIACTPTPACTIPSETTIVSGTTKDYVVTVTDGGGNPLSGKVLAVASNNTAAATVSTTSVTTNASGQATITVSAVGAGSAVITLTSQARHQAIPPGSSPNNTASGSITITVP